MDVKIIEPPKALLSALSQLYDLEQKMLKRDDLAPMHRNVGKMKDAFEELGYRIEDPQGQSYNETRVDLEASIAGSSTDDLVVTEVIKPIIRRVWHDSRGECTQVVQRGIVVVETRTMN